MKSTQTYKKLFSDEFSGLLAEGEEDLRLMACDSNEETALFAHKHILSAKAEVFKKMFEPDVGKLTTKLETTTFSEFEPEVFKTFIEFIYSDCSTLSEKAKQHVMALYRAADKYEIRDLCRDTLRANLNTGNALKILELAEIPFDKTLTDATLDVIKTNMSTISNSTELKAFAENHPNLTVEIVKALSTNTY